MAPYRNQYRSDYRPSRDRGGYGSGYQRGRGNRNFGRGLGRHRSRSIDEESTIGLIKRSSISADSLVSRYSQISILPDLFDDNHQANQATIDYDLGHNEARTSEDAGSGNNQIAPDEMEAENKADHKAPLAAIGNGGTFNSIVRPPVLSKKLLIVWRISLILPFLAAGCLLYLLTYSAPTWRSDWSVVRVNLDGTSWSAVYDSGKRLSGGDNTELASGDPSSERDGEGGGWLTVNMWGWCLQDASATETICSSENMWFDLDELLGEESRSSAPSGDDFNFVLTHALVIHGFAMLAAMTALVPIVLTTWRTVKAKEPSIQGSWFEHGTILAASSLCLVSYIIDRCLKSNVASNLEGYEVKSGYASTMTGISALLLVICFLISGLPVLYFHMKRQSQLLRYWRNLEDYDEAITRKTHEKEINEKGDEGKAADTKRRDGKGRKRSKAYRMTKMFLGYDGDERDRTDFRSERRRRGRDRPRRRGTISRWRTRRRERRDRQDDGKKNRDRDRPRYRDHEERRYGARRRWSRW